MEANICSRDIFEVHQSTTTNSTMRTTPIMPDLNCESNNHHTVCRPTLITQDVNLDNNMMTLLRLHNALRGHLKSVRFPLDKGHLTSLGELLHFHKGLPFVLFMFRGTSSLPKAAAKGRCSANSRNTPVHGPQITNIQKLKNTNTAHWYWRARRNGKETI